MRCDICGREIKTKKIYGYSFSGSCYGTSCDSKLYLCSGCSSELIKEYLDFVNGFLSKAINKANEISIEKFEDSLIEVEHKEEE